MIDTSVVIPAHNCAPYIGEAISSVLAQSCQNLEIIVVDDGSTDGTDRCLPRLPNLHCLSQPRKGPSAARNTGVRAARGDYVAFLDSDDLWQPGSLDARLAFAAAHPELGLIFADACFFNRTGVTRPSYLAGKHVFRRVRTQEASPGCHIFLFSVADELAIEPFIATDTVVARRDCLHKIGLFDESLWIGEDTDVWYRMARLFPIGYVDAVAARCRDRSDSLTSDQELVAAGEVRFVRKMLEYFRPSDSLEVVRHLRRRLGRQLIWLGEIHLARGRTRLARQCFAEGLRCAGTRGPSALRLAATFLGPGGRRIGTSLYRSLRTGERTAPESWCR